MDSTPAAGFGRAVQARSIMEDATPTVFLVAYFGGALVTGTLSSALGLQEMSQFLTLFPICAFGVGVMWWCLREVPKRRKAFERLEVLYPQFANSRKKFRVVEAAITEEREKIITLLKEALRPIGVRQYSGLFLEGGRFERYNGKVPQTSKASSIKETVERFAREHSLQLHPSFVRGMFDVGICVHVCVLGEDLYFG